MLGLFFIALFALVGLAVAAGWSADSRTPGRWYPGQQ